jgi:hypothetical protein
VETVGGSANVVGGVTDPHLSDDRIINRTTFLTAGFSVSVPGEGIAGAFAGGVPSWTGGFINVVVNF